MKPLDTVVEIDIFISKFTALLAERREEKHGEEKKEMKRKTSEAEDIKHGEGKEISIKLCIHGESFVGEVA
jgi:hypothetical protein